jgi:hypothetical protein
MLDGTNKILHNQKKKNIVFFGKTHVFDFICERFQSQEKANE